MNNILEIYDSYLIDETELSLAYTATTAFRSVIKTSLNLTTARFGLPPAGNKTICQTDSLGLKSQLQLKPAPLVIVLVDELSSPASIASAVLTARLAGVPQIIALASSYSSGVIASLDLSGIPILVPPPEIIAEIIGHLPLTSRILSFMQQTLPLKQVNWQDKPRTLGLTNSKYISIIKWSHPRAELILLTDATKLPVLNGLYYDEPYSICDAAPHFLSLACPDLAGTWLNMDLNLDFFHNQQLQVEFIVTSESKEATLAP